MSENSFQRHHGGPGPPYDHKPLQSYMNESVVASQHGHPSGVAPQLQSMGLRMASGVAAGQGMGSKVGGQGAPVGQTMRAGPHTVNFVPASYQPIAGPGMARQMTPAPGYVPFPSSSMYSYPVPSTGGALVSQPPGPLGRHESERGMVVSSAGFLPAPSQQSVPPAVDGSWATTRREGTTMPTTARISSRNVSFTSLSECSTAAATTSTAESETSTITATSESVNISKNAEGNSASASSTESSKPEEKVYKDNDTGNDLGDDDDGVGEFETDGSGKRRRLTAEERLQRSRERNRLHARKTRQRKKVQLQLLQSRSADLQEEQRRLRQAITDRRTANILLGMSGSDESQASDRPSKPVRDQPIALTAVTGNSIGREMRCGRESDDAVDGIIKSSGDNGSDDLGSECTATTNSSGASGRTSSEANSSDGATGGSMEGDDNNERQGGSRGDTEDADEHKVGNPGDAQRLLELSQKDRSECFPEELEQIRRERNRMHAKRTRDRKKLHLEATEGMIARLEQENRRLRDSMKALGSDVTKQAPTASKAAGGSKSASFPTNDQAPKQSGPQPQQLQPPHSQKPTPPVQSPPGQSPVPQYPNYPYVHQGGRVQSMPAVYQGSHSNSQPHALMQTVQGQPLGFYPTHGFDSNCGALATNGVGGAGTASMVKSEMHPYMQNGNIQALGFSGHPNPHYHPAHMIYQSPYLPQGPAGKEPLLSMAQAHHVMSVTERNGNDEPWESHGKPPFSGWTPITYGVAGGAGVTSLHLSPTQSRVRQITSVPGSVSSAGRSPISDQRSTASGSSDGGSWRSRGERPQRTFERSPKCSRTGNATARHAARMRADQEQLDRDLSKGCEEARRKVRKKHSAKRKREQISNSSWDRPCRRPCNSDGVGSGSEGSESSTSSWNASSESSIQPASTISSSEEGRGGGRAARGSAASSRSDSPDSPSFSESDEDSDKTRSESRSRRHERSSSRSPGKHEVDHKRSKADEHR